MQATINSLLLDLQENPTAGAHRAIVPRVWSGRHWPYVLSITVTAALLTADVLLPRGATAAIGVSM